MSLETVRGGLTAPDGRGHSPSGERSPILPPCFMAETFSLQALRQTFPRYKEEAVHPSEAPAGAPGAARREPGRGVRVRSRDRRLGPGRHPPSPGGRASDGGRARDGLLRRRRPQSGLLLRRRRHRHPPDRRLRRSSSEATVDHLVQAPLMITEVRSLRVRPRRDRLEAEASRAYSGHAAHAPRKTGSDRHPARGHDRLREQPCRYESSASSR